jgi:hypothetical protein
MADGTNPDTVLTTADFLADVAAVARQSGWADQCATSAAASAAQAELILEQILGLVGSGENSGLLAQIQEVANSASQAAASASAAAASAAAAAASVTSAAAKVGDASTQASNASTSANAAAASATAAANSATQAAASATAASAASGSATSASNFATAAQASATAANNSATAAASSAAQAQTSATAAQTQASASQTSATASAGSASAAAASASQASTAAASIAGVGLKYLITATLTGTLSASEIIPCPVTVAITLPTNLSGSQFTAINSATAAVILTLFHNSGGTSTPIGTVTFAAGATNGTVTFTNPVVFAAGDLLVITTPSTADSTLANIAIGIVGSVN